MVFQDRRYGQESRQKRGRAGRVFRFMGQRNAQQIELQKEINRNMKDAQRDAKQTKCLICGKLVDGFCNSHSVPEFCLKNISINGEVYYSNTLIGKKRWILD